MTFVKVNMKTIVAAFIATVLAFGVMAYFNPAPVTVDAQSTEQAREGLLLTGGDEQENGQAQDDLGGVISNVINMLSLIVGAISVIMIVVGGLRYVVSAGDSSGTAAARSTIIYALVGLVIVIFAQAIVRFVLDRVDTPAGGDAVVDEAGPTSYTPSTYIVEA